MNVVLFKRSGDQGQMKRKLIDIDLDEASSPYRWYLVRSKGGQHKRAKYEIRRAGFRAVVIMERVERYKHRERRTVTRKQPAFEGYLFVRMPRLAPNWYRLHDCGAVAGVMTTTTTAGEVVPFAIPWRIVGMLLDKQRRGGFDFTLEGQQKRGEILKGKHAKLRSIFRPGARLKVNDGPFAGFQGAVAGVNKHGAIEALIGILGRETPFTFTNPVELEVIEDHSGATAPRAA